MNEDFLNGKIAYSFKSEEDVIDFLEEWYTYKPDPRDDAKKSMLKILYLTWENIQLRLSKKIYTGIFLGFHQWCINQITIL